MKKLFTKRSVAGMLALFFFVLVLIPSGGHVAFAATTGTAQAPNWYTCTTSLGTCIVYYASLSANTFLGLIVSLGAFLIREALQFNGNLYNSPLLQKGFGVSLAIANLGFVLAIIIIAIATMLHSDGYGYKKALGRLVIMAILVNFGLVITRPIVGFADGMTNYFVNAAGGSNEGFVDNLTNAFQVSSLLAPPPANGPCANGAVTTTGGLAPLGIACNEIAAGTANTATPTASADSFTQALMSLLFGIVFLIIVALAFFSIAALLIVRYIWLEILLILLPLAWLMWIFPVYKSQFSKWWSNFIKWTFFPPAALFFVYLAIITISPSATTSQAYLNQVNQSAPQVVGTQAEPEVALIQGLGTTGPIQAALDEFILCAIMLGGLMAASSLTGSAGTFVVGQAKSASNAIVGYAGKKTRSGARNIGDRTRTAGKKYNPATRETTTALQRFGSRLQNVPGLRGAGVVAANVGSPDNVKKSREKEIQEYIDHSLKSLTNDGIISRATSSTAFINPAQAAAVAQEIARRNLTTNPNIIPLMDRFVNAAERLGNLEKVTNNRPDLMPQREKSPGVMETREEATIRAVKGAKAEIIQANSEIFNAANPAAAAAKLGPHATSAMLEGSVLALTPAQLGALGNDGNQDRQNNITDAVKTLIAPFKRLNATTGKFELDVAALATAAATRPDLKNLEKITKHMESNPNWGSVLN